VPFSCVASVSWAVTLLQRREKLLYVYGSISIISEGKPPLLVRSVRSRYLCVRSQLPADIESIGRRPHSP
jgi:hypothetical protein